MNIQKAVSFPGNVVWIPGTLQTVLGFLRGDEKDWHVFFTPTKEKTSRRRGQSMSTRD